MANQIANKNSSTHNQTLKKSTLKNPTYYDNCEGENET